MDEMRYLKTFGSLSSQTCYLRKETEFTKKQQAKKINNDELQRS